MANKVPMKGKRQRRRMECSMNRCGSRDTYMFHRGDDVNRNPLHLCADCIRDIVWKYVDLVGEAEAYTLFGELVDRITPKDALAETAEETIEDAPAEEAPAADKRKKAAK